MALVPPAVVTVTSTVPTPVGEVAVIWLALSTVKEPAALLPNLTAVAPEKLVPVMVTLLPPDVGPVFGLTLATVGGPTCACTSPYWSAALRGLATTAPATVTGTASMPAGEVGVIWVVRLRVKEPAALLPNLTAVTSEKLVPVMVTLVPPCIGPVFGLTLATVGGPNCA